MTDTRHSEIIIIGGGIIGCSIAYHLTKMGKTDVTILEKSGLTHGATWHAAGLVGQLRSSRNTTRMLQRSVALYDQLEKETPGGVDWKKVGSLRLACSNDRLLEIKRSYTVAKSYGLDLHIITPQEAQKLFPIMDIKGVIAAAFIPEDGYIDPSSVTQALARGARSRGAQVHEGVRVTGFETKNGRVQSVLTDKGTYTCAIVINAAGMWARELGLAMGVDLPACALEHQYLVTDTIPDMPANMPTMRDPDLLVYYKPEAGSLAVGGYEHNTLPFGERGIPKAFGQELLQENFERFEPLSRNAAQRVPVIDKVGVRKLINGPIPYSADGDFVMGRIPDLDNAFVASGFLYGIAAGGGAGQMMAEWIVGGAPSLDLWPLDVRRFNTHHNANAFIYPRAVELYGHHYKMHYPFQEHESARGVRTSPLYDVLKDKGAVYGSRGGWERPTWFAPAGVEARDKPCFGRPNWFEHVGMEAKAVREGVALIDQTSFSKIEVRGKGALAALQYLAVTNLDRPVGSTIYTQLCNERGGIEADLTISRLADDHFYIVTGSVFGVHDLSWIKSHLPKDGSVFAYDVTSSRAVINICGPKSRDVFARVTDAPLDNEKFGFSQCRELYIGAARVLAVRIGYVGELGWELHMPSEYARHVYETLWNAGQDLGIVNVGYRAIDSLRMEKGYLYWSGDITPDYNPYEAGLGFKVSLQSKGDFIGRKALEAVKAKGPRQRICQFTLEKDVMVYGGEAIMRKGKVLNVASSAAFGFTVGKPIVLGYLSIDDMAHTDFEVEVLGECIPATRHDQVLYDPTMTRLKC